MPSCCTCLYGLGFSKETWAVMFEETLKMPSNEKVELKTVYPSIHLTKGAQHTVKGAVPGNIAAGS